MALGFASSFLTSAHFREASKELAERARAQYESEMSNAGSLPPEREVVGDNPEEFARDLDSILHRLPSNDPQMHFDLARMYQRYDSHLQAVKEFNEAEKLGANYITTYRGFSYLELAIYDSAIHDFTSAIASHDYNTWYNRSVAYLLADRPQLAVKDIDSAFAGQFYPHPSGLFFYQRGMAYYYLEALDSAVRDFTMAIRSGDWDDDGERARRLAHRAQAYRYLGEYDSAILDLRAAIDFDTRPNEKAKYGIWLYGCLLESGREAEGLAALRSLSWTESEGWPGPLVAYLNGHSSQTADQILSSALDTGQLQFALVTFGYHHLMKGHVTLARRYLKTGINLERVAGSVSRHAFIRPYLQAVAITLSDWSSSIRNLGLDSWLVSQGRVNANGIRVIGWHPTMPRLLYERVSGDTRPELVFAELNVDRQTVGVLARYGRQKPSRAMRYRSHAFEDYLSRVSARFVSSGSYWPADTTPIHDLIAQMPFRHRVAVTQNREEGGLVVAVQDIDMYEYVTTYKRFRIDISGCVPEQLELVQATYSPSGKWFSLSIALHCGGGCTGHSFLIVGSNESQTAYCIDYPALLTQQLPTPRVHFTALTSTGSDASNPPPVRTRSIRVVTRESRIPINVISMNQLAWMVPGLGPHTAQRIVEHREMHGPYRSLDDIDRVPGVGQNLLMRIAERGVDYSNK